MNQTPVRKSTLTLRRLLCFCLVAIMLFALIPANALQAEAISAGEKLYFIPSSGWKADGAWFAAYFFNDSTNTNTWVKMTASNDGRYEAIVPSGYTHVIFCRMNKASQNLDWNNKWNQTGNIQLPTGSNNCFAMDSNEQWNESSKGTWSTLTDYYLVGWINGDDYYETGNYHFVNGSLTVTFTQDSYVLVKDKYSGTLYMTKGYPGDSATSATLYDYSTIEGDDKLLVPGNVEVTFTLTENSDGTFTLSYTTPGGSGGGDIVDIPREEFPDPMPSNTIYIGTTFYDYYSDFEVAGNNRDTYGDFAQGHEHWVPFRQFDTALSDYYRTNNAKVPIYTGHFQPEWNNDDGTPWDWPFAQAGLSLYGFKDGKAYGTTSTDQKYFMSVNNGNLNTLPETGWLDAAAQGIVHDELVDETLMIPDKSSGTIVSPYFDAAFLNGNNSQNKKIGHVYNNVKFPFKKTTNAEGIEVWKFDSETTVLQMQQEPSGAYFLQERTSGRGGFYNMNASGEKQSKYGFFPFNDTSVCDGKAARYNYGYGTRIDIKFNLTKDGMVDGKPIIFRFSGDDDVWVFIDGQLALDIGGSHGKVTGTIDFSGEGTTKTAEVSRVKASGGANVYGYDVQNPFNITGKNTDEHTLTMFYMERGMWKSNMMLEFNFFPVPETTMNVQKVWEVNNASDMTDVDVQLQKQDSTGNWANEGDPFTLTADNQWTHAFKELDVDFNYRVVELREDGTVIPNGGMTDNNLVVSYSAVSGNADIGYSQSITNKSLPSGKLRVTKAIANGSTGDWTTGTFDIKITVGGSNLANGSYPVEGGSRSTVTASNGVVKLYAGETVIVDVAAGSAYTVTETDGRSPNYMASYTGTVTSGTAPTVTSTGVSGTLSSGASASVTVTNSQVGNQVVVIDFGIPVDITVADGRLGEMSGTLVGVGSAAGLTPGFDSTKRLTSSSYPATHGTATKNGNKIRYTPANMQMSSSDKIGYTISYKEGSTTKYYHSTVTVIPAANIYYEDSFITFDNKWVQDGTQTNATQQQDRPGVNTALGELDANNVYGYDEAYDDFTKYSLGRAYKTTVDATSGTKENAPTASFTFTGTGFDVVSLTDNTSGVMWVEVTPNKDNTNATEDDYRSILVNNYYGYYYGLCKVGYTYDGYGWYRSVLEKSNEKTERDPVYPKEPKVGDIVEAVEYDWIVDKSVTNDVYQVPVIKVDGLTYGKYDVTIKVVYLKTQDMLNKGSYTVWLDAIRVYNPAQDDKTSTDAYEQDGENNPYFTTVKSLLVASGGFKSDGQEVNGTVFVDGKASGVSIGEYTNQGPNNETYLEKNNGIAFKLRHTAGTTNAPVVNLQIGAKLATGTSATMSFKQGIMGGDEKITNVELTTATNMFYKIGAVNWTKDNGVWESDPFIIWCSDAANGSILSLTDIKATGANAGAIIVAPATTAADDSTSSSAGNMFVLYDTEVGDLIDDVLGFEDEQTTQNIILKYPTLSFEGEIKYNFYYSVENMDVAVEDMGLITWSAKPDDATITTAEDIIPGAIFNETTGEYTVRTNGIPAKKLGEDLYFRVYAKLSDGSYVYSSLAYYNAKFYAMDRLANSNSADMKALCVAMLNYGAAAQQHFG